MDPPLAPISLDPPSLISLSPIHSISLYPRLSQFPLIPALSYPPMQSPGLRQRLEPQKAGEGDIVYPTGALPGDLANGAGARVIIIAIYISGFVIST